jgi:hypothetical protein
MSPLISRRVFLAGAGSLLYIVQTRWSIVVQDSVTGDMRKGVELGLTEAQQMARLLGHSVELTSRAAGTATTTAGVVVVGAATDSPPSIPVVRLRSSDKAPPACTFTVAASAARKDAALRQWMAQQPGGDTTRLSVVEWHPTLKRFGASELNERFEFKHKIPMSGDAWLGWIAVKALSEAAMRRIVDAAACDEFVRIRFDGHKGSALRFDPGTRELRQPLYILERSPQGERVLGEVNP